MAVMRRNGHEIVYYTAVEEVPANYWEQEDTSNPCQHWLVLRNTHIELWRKCLLMYMYLYMCMLIMLDVC